MVISAKKKKEQDKGQKSLFGSSVSQSTVTKKKTEKPHKKEKVITETTSVPVPSPVETYKQVKEKETREEIIKRYIESYNWGHVEYNYSFPLDCITYNRCCENLEDVLNNNLYNAEIVRDLKRIIISANLTRMQMFFVYASWNMVLFNYVNEVYPLLNTDMLFTVVDRAYAELIYYGK